jgi:hypothetical protein
VLVAHTYNPTYSGGRDQKDHRQSQTRQIVLKTLSQKNYSQKGASGVTQDVGPKFKPQYQKKHMKGNKIVFPVHKHLTGISAPKQVFNS